MEESKPALADNARGSHEILRQVKEADRPKKYREGLGRYSNRPRRIPGHFSAEINSSGREREPFSPTTERYSPAVAVRRSIRSSKDEGAWTSSAGLIRERRGIERRKKKQDQHRAGAVPPIGV